MRSLCLIRDFGNNANDVYAVNPVRTNKKNALTFVGAFFISQCTLEMDVNSSLNYITAFLSYRSMRLCRLGGCKHS
jgi:hypothetical protein